MDDISKKGDLIKERDEVFVKIEKLIEFTSSKDYNSIDLNEKRLIKIQISILRSYKEIINQRIDLIGFDEMIKRFM